MAFENDLSRIDSEFLNKLGRDTLDNEVWIFDDFDSERLRGLPKKLDMPIFALCLQGSARISLNLAEYTIGRCSLIALMPDTIIRGIDPSPDARGIFLGLSQPFVEEILPNIHAVLPVAFGARVHPVVGISDADSACLQDIHMLLWKIIRTEQGQCKRQMVQNVIRAMLYKLIDIYVSRNGKALKRSRNEEIFFSFARLVECDYRIDRTVQYYADRLCITPKHLTTVVKNVSGQTASDWITEYVVLSAKVMLRSSEMTIQEIASELNFPNQSFFGKYFKQHAGMSPQAYRKQDDL